MRYIVVLFFFEVNEKKKSYLPNNKQMDVFFLVHVVITHTYHCIFTVSESVVNERGRATTLTFKESTPSRRTLNYEILHTDSQKID